MKTKCGHKVLFGDITWMMMGGIWDELTDEPAIVVVYFDKMISKHQHGIEIDKNHFQVIRYDNRVPDGISVELSELKGELKTIVDAKIKADGHRLDV
jgi:hypothetical protein